MATDPQEHPFSLPSTDDYKCVAVGCDDQALLSSAHGSELLSVVEPEN